MSRMSDDKPRSDPPPSRPPAPAEERSIAGSTGKALGEGTIIVPMDAAPSFDPVDQVGGPQPVNSAPAEPPPPPAPPPE